MKKLYLGDGVYLDAGATRGAIRLTTEDLEPEVILALQAIFKRMVDQPPEDQEK